MKDFISDELEKRGHDWETLQGLLANQKDYVKEQGTIILREIADALWAKVEAAVAVSEDALDGEFGTQGIALEVIDKVLHDMSIGVSNR